jgi:hypothetical protein
MSVDVIACKRGRYGVGISRWVDRIFPNHGLFDLCASLAGEVLVSERISFEIDRVAFLDLQNGVRS